jgi:hypothetical protein
MSSDMPAPIPEPLQEVVLEFAKRAEFFAESAKAGGSWMQLQTWLVSMQPGYDLLTSIGFDGCPRNARMAIAPEKIEEIVKNFSVPDSLEGGL